MHTALPQIGDNAGNSVNVLDHPIRLVSVNTVTNKPPSVSMTRQPNRAWLLELGHKLQTTLDVDELMRLFFTAARQLVHFDSVRFENVSAGISMAVAQPQRHSCSYNLVLTDQHLGKIAFSSTQPFSTADTAAIEEALCMLLHPMRNALLYRAAINAAASDPLTGLNNRARMDTVLDRDVDLANRHGTPLTVIMLDVDWFKRINDNHGHLTGDCVLRKLAARLGEHVRDSDACFRYGGEEFAVVLANTRLDGALFLAERIREAVAATPFESRDLKLNITVSVGVSVLEKGESGTDLLRKADAALYQSKSRGRNRATAWESSLPAFAQTGVA